MNNDYLDPINSEGMPDLADATFALDFLLTAKTGVRNCAIALSETASPEARRVLRKQLEEGLALHEEISKLMINNGWLHPYNVSDQFQLDMKSAKTTVQIAEMKLFPDDTSRLGLFATPNK
jgi:similar to spore coat protein